MIKFKTKQAQNKNNKTKPVVKNKTFDREDTVTLRFNAKKVFFAVYMQVLAKSKNQEDYVIQGYRVEPYVLIRGVYYSINMNDFGEYRIAQKELPCFTQNQVLNETIEKKKYGKDQTNNLVLIGFFDLINVSKYVDTISKNSSLLIANNPKLKDFGYDESYFKQNEKLSDIFADESSFINSKMPGFDEIMKTRDFIGNVVYRDAKCQREAVDCIKRNIDQDSLSDEQSSSLNELFILSRKSLLTPKKLEKFLQSVDVNDAVCGEKAIKNS